MANVQLMNNNAAVLDDCDDGAAHPVNVADNALAGDMALAADVVRVPHCEHGLLHLLRRAKLILALPILTMSSCNDVKVDSLHQVAEDVRIQRHELRAVTDRAVTVVIAHLAVGCTLESPLPGAKVTRLPWRVCSFKNCIRIQLYQVLLPTMANVVICDL